MSNGTSYKIRRGDEVRVIIHKRQDKKIILLTDEERAKLLCPPPLEEEIEYQGRPRITFHDIATRFAHLDPNVRTGWAPVLGHYGNAHRGGEANYVNGYYELDTEILSADIGSLSRIKAGYLNQDPLGTSKTTLAERSVSNTWQLYRQGGTPSGSLFLDAHLKNVSVPNPVDHRYELSTASTLKGWIEQIPVADRLSKFLELEDEFSGANAQADFEAQKSRLLLEQRELWLSTQSALTKDKSGVLVPVLPPGSYDLSLVSPFYYEEFDTKDKVKFKITRDPYFTSEETDCPRVHSGLRNGQRVKVLMVPQFWRVRAQWKAWYLFFTLWAYTFVFLPSNMIFLNRFPLFPRPFALGSTDYAPVWYWIERSMAHQTAVAGDLALNFFSPYMSFIFLFTSDGFYEIRQTDTFPGMLVAVLEYDGLVRYVWRRISTHRDLSLQISAGPLNTYHVNAWGANIIGTQIF